MELRYLLLILRANARFIGLVMLVASAVALLATYALPERFEASTTVLIRPEKNASFSPSSSTMMDYPVSFAIPVESMSQTYAELMASEAVAIKIVDSLELDRPVSTAGKHWIKRTAAWARDSSKLVVISLWELAKHGKLEKEDPHHRAVRRVLDNIKAEPVPDTYLFTLTASWDDPELAARIADTAATVFIEYTHEAQRSEDGTSAAFLAEQMSRHRQELDQARDELRGFEQLTKAASLQEQLSLRLNSLSAFENEREDAIRRLREVEAEISEFKSQLAAQSEQIHSSTTMARNPTIVDLNKELSSDEVELAGLSQTHQQSHPAVQRLQARIADTTRRLAAEESQVRLQDTSAANPIHGEVKAKLLDRNAVRDALEARMAALNLTLGKYRTSVEELTNQKSEFERLNLEVRVLESEYELISKEYAEARLAAAREISEIRVLSPAIAPVYAEGPIKVFYVGGALILGFLSPLAFVLILDYMDPRIRSHEDVERALGAPVLVTLDAPGAREPLVPRRDAPPGEVTKDRHEDD